MMTLPHTVTIVRAGRSTDRYGNPSSPSWDTPSLVDVAGWMQPGTGRDVDSVDADTDVNRWTALLEPAADIAADDRLVWDGRTFRVLGTPGLRTTPRGPHHWTVAAEEVVA